MPLNQTSSTVSELRSVRSRSNQPKENYPGPTPTTGYQHPSVVRYFKSLTDTTWNESDSDQYSTQSEPEYASDVEVLVVHRQASHQDIVQSRDKTYRILLDMFDWDAMKMPVESSGPAEGEQSSGEETDSADESEAHSVAVIGQPRSQVIIIPAQSMVQYVVARSDIQTALFNRAITASSKLPSNGGSNDPVHFIIDGGNLRHPAIRSIMQG